MTRWHIFYHRRGRRLGNQMSCCEGLFCSCSLLVTLPVAGFTLAREPKHAFLNCKGGKGSNLGGFDINARRCV